MSKMVYSDPILTPVFRASFPHLFTPFTFDAGQYSTNEDPFYQVVMGFDKEAEGINWFRESMGQLVKKVWPNGWPDAAHSPVKDGDQMAGDFGGRWLVKAKSRSKPGVVDCDGETTITDPERIYGGCYLRATIVLAAYTGLSGGVTVYLNNVQFVRDGERFGSGTSAASDFGAIGPATPPQGGSVMAGNSEARNDAPNSIGSYQENQLPF